jgi:hypothetical protein
MIVLGIKDQIKYVSIWILNTALFQIKIGIGHFGVPVLYIQWTMDLDGDYNMCSLTW